MPSLNLANTKVIQVAVTDLPISVALDPTTIYAIRNHGGNDVHFAVDGRLAVADNDTHIGHALLSKPSPSSGGFTLITDVTDVSFVCAEAKTSTVTIVKQGLARI